jgi:hypothetical protein
MIQIIEIQKGDPLFKSEEEYRRFRESYCESVKEDMEKHRIARLKSERESMFRIVD